LIITALVVFCCTTLSVDTPTTPAPAPALELRSVAVVQPAEDAKPAKPDMPTPKLSTSLNEESAPGTSVESASPGGAAFLNAAVKPATPDSFETPRKRKIWYGLVAVGHGASAFDAWTTRRAVSSGYGVEGDPLQRPFAHSGAIYATTQVCPLVMDYLGRRMMRSSHPLLRRFWWLPQSASAGVSLGAGIHNYSVVP
jgi:hypothetical protein